MKRHKGKERPNYVQIVNKQGLVYTHDDPNGNPLLYRYWRDGEWYSFTLAEIDVLETAAAKVFEMCVEAGDWLLSAGGEPYLNRFGIRKLVLLNAHGGNSPLMTIVATEARVRFASP